MRVAVFAAFATALCATSAPAQEVTLRAVSSFAEKTQFSRNFERFIDRVNETGKGKVQINYIGGPRAMVTLRYSRRSIGRSNDGWSGIVAEHALVASPGGRVGAAAQRR